MKTLTIMAGSALLSLAPIQQGGTGMQLVQQVQESQSPDHPYSGMWVTADGYVRHHLLPNGRYDEARGSRESAYQGRYRVTGNHIDYWDDTGFTADGEFIDDVLHHGGMILYRRE